MSARRSPQSQPTHSSQSWFQKNWIILLTFVLAFLLRLPGLGRSFSLSEANIALDITRPFSEQHFISNNFQPPFLNYWLYFASQIHSFFSPLISEAYLRIVGALIPALLTIPVIFLLTRKLFNKRLGFLATLLLSLSPLHISFSGVLSPYVWTVLWGLLSWLFLLEFLNIGSEAFRVTRNSSSDRFLRRLPFGRNFFFYVFATIAGLYSSYFYFLILIPQLIYLCSKKRFTNFFTVLIFVIIGFFPWLMFLLSRQPFAQVPPQFLFTSPFSLTSFSIVSWLPFLCVLVIFISQLFSFWRTKKSSFSILIFLLLLPLLLAGLLNWCFFSSSDLITGSDSINQIENQNINWREQHAQIRSEFSSANSIVLFSYPTAFAPWRWYENQTASRSSGNFQFFPILPTGHYYLPDHPEALVKYQYLADTYEYVIVVNYGREQTDPDNQLDVTLGEYGYESAPSVYNDSQASSFHVWQRKDNL